MYPRITLTIDPDESTNLIFAVGTIVKVEFNIRKDLPVTNIVFVNKHAKGSTYFRISYHGIDAIWTYRFYELEEPIGVKGRLYAKTYKDRYILQIADPEVLIHRNLRGQEALKGVFPHMSEFYDSVDEEIKKMEYEYHYSQLCKDADWYRTEEKRKAEEKAEEERRHAEEQQNTVPDFSKLPPQTPAFLPDW